MEALRWHFKSQANAYFRTLPFDVESRQPFGEFYEPFVGTFSTDKADLLQCVEPECRKDRKNMYRHCSMHVAMRFRQRNPITYKYNNLKTNAKKRGKSFTLTLRFFRLFCWASDYNENSGRLANDYSIDRIDNARGYERGNIQVLTGAENSEKYHHHDKVPEWMEASEEEALPF